MQPSQIDINDPYTDSATALRYADLTRADHERYAERVAQALAQLDGRARRDAGAKWARPQVQAEARAIRKQLDRADHCSAELEMTRESYRAACLRCDEGRASIESATDADALLRAQAQLELDVRAARAARAAFASAAAKAKLPSLNGYALWRGLQLHQGSSDNAQIARGAAALGGFEKHERNSTDATTARSVAYNCGRDVEPVRLVWEIAAECGFRAGDPHAGAAFDLRFEAFARKAGLADLVEHGTAAE